MLLGSRALNKSAFLADVNNGINSVFGCLIYPWRPPSKISVFSVNEGVSLGLSLTFREN
jgi:hypothetical protein